MALEDCPAELDPKQSWATGKIGGRDLASVIDFVSLERLDRCTADKETIAVVILDEFASARKRHASRLPLGHAVQSLFGAHAPMSGEGFECGDDLVLRGLLTRKRERDDERGAERNARDEPGHDESTSQVARSAHRTILAWWLASRLIVFAVAVLIDVLDWPRRLSGGPFSALATWDGNWYRLIAERGYFILPGHQSNVAFFPLLPEILALGRQLGLPVKLTGLVVAEAAFLAALLLFYHLSRRVLRGDDALRATIFVAIGPYSLIFSMIYPEPLVLLGFVVAALLAADRHWLLVTPMVAASTLARPQGALIVIPLAAIVANQWSRLEVTARARAVGAVLAAPAALVSYPLYLWVVLDEPLAWSKSQEGWGRTFDALGPWHALIGVFTAPNNRPWLARDAIFFLLYVVLLLVARRAGVGRGWLAFGFALIVLPLVSGSFQSVGRFGALALPVYWGLGYATRRGWLERALIAGALLGLVAMTFSLAWQNP